MKNFYMLDVEDQRRASFQRLSRYIRDVIYPYHPFYRKLMKENGVHPDQIRTPDDLRRIPVNSKEDYRSDPIAFIVQPKLPGREALYDTASLAPKFYGKYLLQSAFNYPRDYARLYRVNYKEPYLAYKMIGRRVAQEWLPIHFHASAGSTGDPTPAVYTYRDLHVPAAEAAAAVWAGRDVTWDIRALNMFPGAPHLAFFQVLMGKWLSGASGFDTFGGAVVPTDKQIVLFGEGGFEALVAIPSYLVYWLRKAVDMIDNGQAKPLTKLRMAMAAAEPLTEPLRAYIKELVLKAGGPETFKLVQGYGMTEMKIAFYECTERSMIHLNPKFFYWEVLDPETGEPVPQGEPGVLTFSHIDWRGTTFLRYSTGDLITGGVRYERCPHCGLTYPIMYPPIMRAKKDFTKLKGTRVSLFELISSIRDTRGVYQFQAIMDKETPGDEFSRDVLIIKVAIEEGFDGDKVVREIEKNVKGTTEVHPDRIEVVGDREALEAELFARTGIKADYVVENRPVHI